MAEFHPYAVGAKRYLRSLGGGLFEGTDLRGDAFSFFAPGVCPPNRRSLWIKFFFFLIRANLNVPPFCFNYTLNQVFHVWNWKLLYGLISFFPSFFFPEAGFYLKSLGDIFWYFCSRASNHLLLIKKENEVCRKKEKKKIIFINWYFWAIGLLQGLFWNIFWSQRTIHFLSINLKRLYILT